MTINSIRNYMLLGFQLKRGPLHSLAIFGFALVIGSFSPLINAAPTLQNSTDKVNPATSSESLKKENLKNPQVPRSIIKIPPNREQSFSKKESSLKFTLGNIRITGNTAIATESLEKIYKNKIGKVVTLGDIEEIAQSITEYYRNSDYILSQAIIPAQEITNKGSVKIQVIEGFVNKVTITGCTSDTSYELLEEYGKKIAASVPLKLSVLERYAFLANDIPGAEVRAVLSKSTETISATDLTFVVKQKNVGGYVGFNDYNSAVLGRQQYLVSASAYNIMSGSETTIRGNMARFNERLKYINLAHSQQLNSDGLSGNISASYIKTNPDLSTIGIPELQIPGKAVTASAGLDYAWIRSHAKNFYVGTAFNFTNSKTTFAGSTLFYDKVRTANVYVTYSFLFGAQTYNTISLMYTRGLKVLGAADALPSRAGEDLTFSKLTLNLSSAHRFGSTNLSYLIAASSQYAFNRVPSSETISYGGMPYGYGYDSSSISGDRGVNAKAELQYMAFSKQSFSSQLFMFVDTGYVWNINKDILPTHQNGVSVGTGLRGNAMQHLMFDFIVAQPLNPNIANNGKGYTRILFNIRLYA